MPRLPTPTSAFIHRLLWRRAGVAGVAGVSGAAGVGRRACVRGLPASSAIRRCSAGASACVALPGSARVHRCIGHRCPTGTGVLTSVRGSGVRAGVWWLDDGHAIEVDAREPFDALFVRNAIGQAGLTGLVTNERRTGVCGRVHARAHAVAPGCRGRDTVDANAVATCCSEGRKGACGPRIAVAEPSAGTDSGTRRPTTAWLSRYGQALPCLSWEIAGLAAARAGGLAAHPVDAEVARALTRASTVLAVRELGCADAAGAVLVWRAIVGRRAVPIAEVATTREWRAGLFLQRRAGSVTLTGPLEGGDPACALRVAADDLVRRIHAAVSNSAVARPGTLGARASARRPPVPRLSGDDPADSLESAHVASFTLAGTRRRTADVVRTDPRHTLLARAARRSVGLEGFANSGGAILARDAVRIDHAAICAERSIAAFVPAGFFLAIGARTRAVAEGGGDGRAGRGVAAWRAAPDSARRIRAFFAQCPVAVAPALGSVCLALRAPPDRTTRHGCAGPEATGQVAGFTLTIAVFVAANAVDAAPARTLHVGGAHLPVIEAVHADTTRAECAPHALRIDVAAVRALRGSTHIGRAVLCLHGGTATGSVAERRKRGRRETAARIPAARPAARECARVAIGTVAEAVADGTIA